jgi:hypothetical protein
VLQFGNPCLEKYTMKSKLIEIKDTFENLLKDVEFPAFIKLDTVSCKDTKHNGIFHSISEVEEVFKSSNRIQDTLAQVLFIRKYHCLFIREIDYDIVNKNGLEMRCFIYEKRLTAISCDNYVDEIMFNEIVQSVKSFFDKIMHDIPYMNSTVDIFFSYKSKITVIEVNNFGTDSPTGSSQYNWREDYFILYGGFPKVEFRCGDSYVN